MWMVHQVLPPRVQHGQEADLRAQMFRIGGDGAQCLRRRPEQDVVNHGLVLEGDDLDLRRHREHDVEVRHVEQFRLTILQPLRSCDTLAFWTVAVPTGVVGRTTGGKGLHVVVPLTPDADWDTAKRFCRAFAELMSDEDPKRYLAHLKIADRRGRILIDWLRNGMGATAAASFCPRARQGAAVATPLAWGEVRPGLDPSSFTVSSVPSRLRRMRTNPWKGFAEIDQRLSLSRISAVFPTMDWSLIALAKAITAVSISM
jgi:LigD-like primase-polymerase